MEQFIAELGFGSSEEEMQEIQPKSLDSDTELTEESDDNLEIKKETEVTKSDYID